LFRDVLFAPGKHLSRGVPGVWETVFFLIRRDLSFAPFAPVPEDRWRRRKKIKPDG
jgi:hypothetical protein